MTGSNTVKNTTVAAPAAYWIPPGWPEVAAAGAGLNALELGRCGRGPVRCIELAAVRSGKWKLYLGGAEGKGRRGSRGSALYDLEADIGEKANVLPDHPDVAERLRGYARAFEEDLAQNCRPAGFVADAKPLTKREN